VEREHDNHHQQKKAASTDHRLDEIRHKIGIQKMGKSIQETRTT